MLLILDSGPLGFLCNPKSTGISQHAYRWARRHLEGGDELVVPEIADYEVRRELLRADKQASLARLDELCVGFLYMPLTTAVMHEAAALWAEARNSGQPTAHQAALDGDVILAAQARSAQVAHGRGDVLVATTNADHLSLYTRARQWSEI